MTEVSHAVVLEGVTVKLIWLYVIAHARNVYLDALVVPGCDELGPRRRFELIDVELEPSGDDPSTTADCR